MHSSLTPNGVRTVSIPIEPVTSNDDISYSYVILEPAFGGAIFIGMGTAHPTLNSCGLEAPATLFAEFFYCFIYSFERIFYSYYVYRFEDRRAYCVSADRNSQRLSDFA
jgi:hypothetical protein